MSTPPDTAPTRGALHQDDTGAMWAGDGEAWVRLPEHAARMIHERDYWHETARSQAGQLRVLAEERHDLRAYALALEDVVADCARDDDVIYNDVDGLRAEHGMIDPGLDAAPGDPAGER